MSRDDGFAIADTDTGMLSDPKVLALARRLRDPVRTGAAIALYDAVRLASWKAGTRLTLDETLPGWWLEPWEDLGDALTAAGLLDAERRIPEHAFEGWYGPARDRREHYRELAAKGGRASVQARREAHAQADAEAHAQARPYRPSVPTVRPSVRAAAHGSDGYDDGECAKCHLPITATDSRVFTDPDGRRGYVHEDCYVQVAV